MLVNMTSKGTLDTRGKIIWITRTAMFIALLIVMQAVTAPLGNTLITGSLVNMMLAVSVIFGGLWSGIAVAFISPFFASVFGIAPPFPVIIPFIAAGNGALVIVWYFVSKLNFQKLWVSLAAMILGAVAKFLVLYVGVTMLVVPIILGLPEPQASVISGVFSFPQLITALIGGTTALLVSPMVMRAQSKSITRDS